MNKAKAPRWREYARRERGVIVSRGHFCILWEVDEQRRDGKALDHRTRTELGAPLYRTAPENAHLTALFDIASTAVRALSDEARALEDKRKRKTTR